MPDSPTRRAVKLLTGWTDTELTDLGGFADDQPAQDGDYWGEDPSNPIIDWQREVADGDTRLGYWQWIEAQKEWKQASVETYCGRCSEPRGDHHHFTHACPVYGVDPEGGKDWDALLGYSNTTFKAEDSR